MWRPARAAVNRLFSRLHLLRSCSFVSPTQLVLNATSPLGTDVLFDYPKPTGGREPYQVTCDPGPGIFPIGETSVSCTATDADMAQASCGFTVRVRVPQTIAKTKFVAFGDSITAGAVSLVPFITLALSETYPNKLEQFLRQLYPAQEIVVLNSGKGAEHTGKGRNGFPACSMPSIRRSSSYSKGSTRHGA